MGDDYLNDKIKDLRPFTVEMGFESQVSRIMKESERQQKEFTEIMKDKQQKEDQFKKDVLNVLLGIEKNTGNLSEIMQLIRDGQDKQDEIISLITSALEIVKAHNEEEAESKYRNAMNKIARFTGDIEVIQKITMMATVAYQFVKATF